MDDMEILKKQYEDVVEAINGYNKALGDNDYAAMSRFESELKDAETAYADTQCRIVFKQLASTENPIKSAIARHSYFVVSHKVDHESSNFEVVENKEKQIDLIKFCTACKFPTMWQYTVEKFNQLLALRAANELKMTKAQIKQICDSIYMNRLSREVEMGKTPDSNTAICKQLQQVIDAILFEDDGNGKNIYKANNHDVAYILMCYTKRGKKNLSVAVAKNAYMHRLVMDVMHRIITGKVYDLEYRMMPTEKNEDKAKKAGAPSTKTAEAKDTVVIEK